MGWPSPEAVACRLAAGAVREGERAWQEILGEGKLAQAGELTLPEAGGFRALGLTSIWK